MRSLVDRIWMAHPLALAHRAVLLAIQRQLSDGCSEVLLNRAALARDLEVSPSVVSRAISAGELVGLCRLGRAGAVAFLSEGLPGIVPEPKAPVIAVQPAPDGTAGMSPGPKINARWVQAEFARQWEAKYGQRYVFEPRDSRAAATVSSALQPGDIVSRIGTYLKHPDPWYAKCAHSFRLFTERVNQFGIASPVTGLTEAQRAEARYQRQKQQAAR